MKTNASTNTEIEEYKVHKRLSLQSLFMPQFRYNLLLDKVINSLYNPSFANNESQMDFSNKSIFIYHYKNRKSLINIEKKANSVKNINCDIIKYPNLINRHFIQKNLSINSSLNNNKKIIHYNSSNKNINNNFTNNNKHYKIKLQNINDSRNDITIHDKQFSKTSEKMNTRLIYLKKRSNLSDITEKLNLKTKTKKNEGKKNFKLKMINFNNTDKKKKNYFLSTKKDKVHKLRIKRF